MWLYAGIICLFRKPLNKLYNKKIKLKPYRVKNKKYIRKIVARIMRIASKHTDILDSYYDLASYSGDYHGEWMGYKHLLVNQSRYERLNKAYIRLMCHQQEETYNELITYFNPVTWEIMEQDGYDADTYMRLLGDKQLYKIK